ncbi:hypothetical protein Sulac_3558 (plasmid) [Sulfobacillus acidophilus DSM 10332]|uniref:Carboxymuconolactone decarboxylase-like domain-containing protein n=1 Tax=Sulfobacillus acidophilus (strain ATCC 700253 / DSM 10332 / NAL) TaxID=679936 RepID=G8U1R3_SULAD|nr:hypothetical protein Sulac_3558 [Sulfobacillus acidophilus DSM 10332]
MPNIKRSHFQSNPNFKACFAETHQTGVLDAKTKELMHLALVLALHCEP